MNFRHGGNREAFASEIGCKVEEVIDLSSNINFVKPKIEFDFNSLDISAYPTYDALYSAIAKLYGVQNTQMELFNGASSAIFSLFRLFDATTVTLYSPAYLEYKKVATQLHSKIELISRFSELYKEVSEGSLVVFVNPSTPDGSFYDIERLIKSWIEKKCIILIDESFLDFTNHPSAIKYLKEYDKLYILKSMTKFYSSAGMRLGVVISKSENIKRLQQEEPLWKISQFDSHYIQEALKDRHFVQRSNTLNRENREYLVNLMQNFRYTKEIMDSSANFILVELQGIDASTLQELLKPYKIMLRDCSNFDFLDAHFVRIAVKCREDLEVLAKGLEEIAF